MTDVLSAPETWARLRASHAAVRAYFEGLAPDDAFHRPHPESWRPVDDLVHLTLATRALVRGFGLPGPALEERFGPAEAPSRPCRAIAALGREALDGGATSPPAVVPEGAFAEAADRAEALGEALAEWRAATAELEALEDRWSEEELDRYRIPHPFLGLFTLREWLCFNHVHARHHLANAERRLGRTPDREGDAG